MYNEIELYKHTHVFMILELITIHLTKPASSVTNQGQSIVFAFLVFLRVPDSTSMCCPDAHKQRFVALVAVGVFELKSLFQIFTHKQTTLRQAGHMLSKTCVNHFIPYLSSNVPPRFSQSCKESLR